MSKSNVQVKDDLVVITDTAQLIDDTVEEINKVATRFKDRNLVGPKREEVSKVFTACIEQLVNVVAAGLTEKVIDEDKYNVLQAKVSEKDFKGCAGHVNSIIKKYIKDTQNVPVHKGAEISSIEVAKLIKTPFKGSEEKAKLVVEDETSTTETLNPKFKEIIKPDNTDTSVLPVKEVVTITPESLKAEGYDDNQMKQVPASSVPEENGDTVEKITTIDGDEVIIDKEDKSIYMKGVVNGEEVTWKKKLLVGSFTWAETVKNILGAFFGLVWDLVLSTTSSVLFGIVGIGSVTLETISHLGTGIFDSGKKAWKGIRNSHANAVKKAREKGHMCGELFP